MSGIEIGTKRLDPKVLLSTLWTVVMINMVYADVISLHIPGTMEEVAKTAGGTPIPLLMLGGAIIIELPLLMIILSRVLKYQINRWANMIVAILTIVFVVGGSAPYPHYYFIAAIEVVCMFLIIWNAWKWRNPEEQSSEISNVQVVQPIKIG
jgi:lysylphosphatidylglycerol synthetase-like protein (DUF2156 family)